MESDLKVTVMVNDKPHFDYVVKWEGSGIVSSVNVSVPAGEIKTLEVRIGRCICKLLDCPVHGEVNQKLGAEGV